MVEDPAKPFYLALPLGRAGGAPSSIDPQRESPVRPMKKFLVAAALLSLAACANTQKNAVGSAENANAPSATCTGACGEGAECCSAKTECTAEKASEAAVCPVTGKPASN